MTISSRYTDSKSSFQIQDLTLEEKIGQMLLVNVEGTSANAESKKLICNHHVGGIVYFNHKNELSSPQQVKELSAGLQEMTRLNRISIPLFIALDQEGGLVARLREGFTIFPGNKALAMTGDVSLAEKSAKVMGCELRAVGINLNLAPVVDINNNPKNPVIGIRSYGETADVVSQFASAALRGFKSAGLITTLKHFPGHGDVDVDSHEDLPVVAKSRHEMEEFELRPFFALAPQTDAIMTAHIMVPAIDSQNCSTLSRSCLDLLRERNFRGIIISDCLTMKGVLKNAFSIQDAALKAIEAGCDIVLFAKGDADAIGNIKSYLIQAVQEGRVDINRIDQSVKRIFCAKQHIEPSAYSAPAALEQSLNTPESNQLSVHIASRALRMHKRRDDLDLIPLSRKICAIIALKMHQPMIEQSSMISIGRVRYVQYVENFEPTAEQIDISFNISRTADVAIICTSNAWRYNAQRDFLQRISELSTPLIHVATRDIADISLLPNAGLAISTFSPTPPALQAVGNHLLQNYG